MNLAEKIITEQANALNMLAQNIPQDFSRVVESIAQTKGKVVLMGVGKSGYIARKIASSMAATGTSAFFVHPAEASHGDLGMITKSDIVIMISNSGETKELTDSINYCKRSNIKIIAMTMNPNSSLARESDFILNIPKTSEISSLSLPTTSSLMMLSLGDALTVALHELKNFTRDDYFNFHPGGKIGIDLMRIKELMHYNDSLPLVKLDNTFSSLVLVMNEKRLGCAAVIDDKNHLLGFITDGDLRRHASGDLNNLTAEQIMTKSPLWVNSNSLVTEVLFLMNSKKITSMPVMELDKIVGIIHIHDILKLI